MNQNSKSDTGGTSATERTDTDRLDWLESKRKGYGAAVVRPSTTGRGLRLHESSKTEGWPGVYGFGPSIRDAIDAGMDADAPSLLQECKTEGGE